jgi:hypothetical protein
MNSYPEGFQDCRFVRRNALASCEPAPHAESPPHNQDYLASLGEFAPHRFHLIPFDKISIADRPTYLAKGLIPRVGLTVIWGPPKCGKSFFARVTAPGGAEGPAVSRRS